MTNKWYFFYYEKDNQLDQIIEGNEKIKNKMVTANESMDKVHEKIIKNTKKT